MSGGERDVTIDYFINMIQYVAYMLSAYFFVFSNSIYIIFVVLVIVFAVFDAFEEGKDIIPSARRIQLSDIFKCTLPNKNESKKDKKAKLQEQKFKKM